MKDERMCVGMSEGEVCNRNECQGTIELEDGEDCACHISPPCHYCLDRRFVCTACGICPDEET